jgi:hypothetical protein
VAVLAAPWPGTTADFRSGFDSDPAGQAPPGWTCAITGEGTPVWHVVADATAPSPPQVLEQSGRVPKPSFPLCLHDAAALRDGFVEVKFKTVSGEVDQAAGVVWRARDAANYYLCRANALEDNVVLYKVENGKRTALAPVGRPGSYGVDVKVPRATWQALRVEFAGPRFRVFLEGRELFTVEDTTFTGAGQVGLWTKADSVTRFDDFRHGALE